MKIKPPIIGVIGSSTPNNHSLGLAYEVGRLLAEAGAILVTGGLGGVMEAASKGCSEAGGLVVGILPGDNPGAANPYVDIVIPSGMGHARNVLVAQTSQALIAVEGALGTLSEIAIGLKTGRPVFLLGSTLQVDGAIRATTAQLAVSAALLALEEGEMSDRTPMIGEEEHSCCGSAAVEKLIDWIRGKGRILIVTHDNPDPDALAAAVALRHLLLMGTGETAVVAFGGVIGRSENRLMVEALDLKLVPITELDFDDFEIICMVDTQPGTGNNSYPAERPLHLLIDHHPPRRDYSDIHWADVRPGYGASATILYEYLRTLNISIATRLATCLFYAIKSETQDLGREWSKADREAYLHLLPLANNAILYRLSHPPVSNNYYSTFHRAIDNATLYGKVLVFNLYCIENPDLVAELADFLLRQEEVSYVMGLGWYKGDELISVRTTDPEGRLGAVIQEMIVGIGTAGGHGMMAGGQIRGVAEDKGTQKELEHLLTRRYIKILGLQSEPGVALLEKEG